MPCPRCGTEIRPPARFCRRCGTSATGEPPARKAPSRNAGVVFVLVAIAAIVAGFVFFLTRGDDEDTTPAAGTGTPDGSAGAGASTAGATTDSRQARSEIETLLARVGDAPFKVVYDVTAEEKGTKTAVKGTLTLANAAPRMALIVDAGPGGLDLSGLDPETPEKLQVLALVTDGQKAWLCQKYVGSDGECIESAVDPADDSADVSQLFDEVLATGAEDELFQAQEVKGQKIAGRDTRCYQVGRSEAASELSTDASFTVCIDKAEGLPLLLEGKLTAKGSLGEAGAEAGIDVGVEVESLDASWSIKAKNVQFRASDDDFKPPFKVTATE